MKSIAHVGIDVHAGQFRFAILPEGSAKFADERTIARDQEQVVGYLQRWADSYELHCYYEAGCLGYPPYRWLTEAGIDCVVTPPALVPRAPGDRVRTDPKDARRLAQQGRAGTLRAVYVPNQQQEAARTLVRWRMTQRQELRSAQQRVEGLLLTRDIRYTAGRKYWTQTYRRWVRQVHRQGAGLEPVERLVLGEQLAVVDYLIGRMGEADRQVRELAATPEYAPAVGRLACFRGIDVLAAMSVITETIDFSRFPSAPAFMSYWGLTCAEDSSGTSRRLGAITKAGEEGVRWVLVQASWSYQYAPAVSEALRQRQLGQPAEVVTQAMQAQHYLHRRFMRLSMRRGRQKALVAVARELAGFLWGVMVR